MTMASVEVLRSYEGHDIADICPHGFDDAKGNHCAHFVSHVLQLSFGLTCTKMVGPAGAEGANIRVKEIFERCSNPREILLCPTRGSGLIFVSHARSFRGNPVTIRNVRKKHIGLVVNGVVWHYSNTRDKVVTQTVADFLRHYRKQTNALWWAPPPADSRPTPFGTSS